MHHLNQKGVTLLELLVSIGLMATVLLFLFNLLVDLQYNSNHHSYAKKNQVNRLTIIKTIQDDFIDKKVDLTRIISNFSSNHTLVIPFQDGTSKLLEVKEDYIRYGNDKWLISRENNGIKYDTSRLSVAISSNANQYRYLKITIPVNTKSSLDDLELFYIG